MSVSAIRAPEGEVGKHERQLVAGRNRVLQVLTNRSVVALTRIELEEFQFDPVAKIWTAKLTWSMCSERIIGCRYWLPAVQAGQYAGHVAHGTATGIGPLGAAANDGTEDQQRGRCLHTACDVRSRRDSNRVVQGAIPSQPEKSLAQLPSATVGAIIGSRNSVADGVFTLDACVAKAVEARARIGLIERLQLTDTS